MLSSPVLSLSLDLSHPTVHRFATKHNLPPVATSQVIDITSIKHSPVSRTAVLAIIPGAGLRIVVGKMRNGRLIAYSILPPTPENIARIFGKDRTAEELAELQRLVQRLKRMMRQQKR